MSTEYYQTADTVTAAFNVDEIGTEKELTLTASTNVLITVIGKSGYVWVSETTAANEAGLPVKVGEQLITENYGTLFVYSNRECTVFCTPGQLTAPA